VFQLNENNKGFKSESQNVMQAEEASINNNSNTDFNDQLF
jgi:hypothetical protein